MSILYSADRLRKGLRQSGLLFCKIQSKDWCQVVLWLTRVKRSVLLICILVNAAWCLVGLSEKLRLRTFILVSYLAFARLLHGCSSQLLMHGLSEGAASQVLASSGDGPVERVT